MILCSIWFTKKNFREDEMELSVFCLLENFFPLPFTEKQQHDETCRWVENGNSASTPSQRDYSEFFQIKGTKKHMKSIGIKTLK